MRRKPDKPRVICIGWHKTGTTTLGSALLKLGYSVLGCRLDSYYPLVKGDMETALAMTDAFDAVQDVPWAALFRELDERYPGSKFILTVRDEDFWLRSAERHFGESIYPLHGWLYGEECLSGNEQLYLERFRRHYTEVRHYFAGRPDQLLELDISADDQWTKICTFLAEPVPATRFPHDNQAPNSLRGIKKLRRVAKEILPEVVPRLWFHLRLKYRSLRGLPDPRNKFNNFPMNRIESEKIKLRKRPAHDARDVKRHTSKPDLDSRGNDVR